MSDDDKPAEVESAEPAYVDPWSAKQRDILNSVLAFNNTKECDTKTSYPTAICETENYLKFMQELFSKHKFDMLKSHTCVDWPEEGKFEMLTLLFSTTHLEHIWVSCFIPRDNPVIETICKIWPIAEFQEREVYDLFGIGYANHPDLRRLFLEDNWKGFPLRKDYQDDFMLERPE